MPIVLALALACGRPDPASPDDRADPDAPAGCPHLAWYADEDADGWGRGEAIHACERPAGATDRPGDCDDLDPGVFPTAPEVCDGRDQDCDDAIDDGAPAILVWLDADEDGWGMIELSIEVCPIPSRWSTRVGDCDDLDATRHPDEAAAVRFTDVTAESGLDVDDVPLPAATCLAEALAGGAAVGDVDGDGDDDVFLPRVHVGDALYLNQGDGTFVLAAAGVEHVGTSSGALFFDADGDADLDLYVTAIGAEPNRLYVNDGTGHFTEEAAARGADVPLGDEPCSTTFGVSAGDVDGDGDLDLHVSQWAPTAGTSTTRSRLLLNDGAGVFVDGTDLWNADLSGHAAFTSAFVDHDGDGDLDLAVAADWGTSALLRNDGGAFTDVTAAVGVGTDENGMGADWADVDGDGDLDWFVTSVYDAGCSPFGWGCTGNRLYRNDGDGFTDITDLAGVRDGGWGWGVAFFDHDHDGLLDAVQANGYPWPLFTGRLRLWAGRGGGTFEDVACDAGLVAWDQTRSVVPFDFDRDGDLDVLVTRAGRSPVLLRNDGGNDRSWLQVSIADSVGEPFGVGAIVEVVADGARTTRTIHRNGTYLAAGPPRAHVGLGDHEDPVDVIVRFPDGGVAILADVPVRQHVLVTR